MLAATLAFGKIDPVKEVGLDLEQQRYNTRLEALSDPKGYAAKRQTLLMKCLVISESQTMTLTGASSKQAWART